MRSTGWTIKATCPHGVEQEVPIVSYSTISEWPTNFEAFDLVDACPTAVEERAKLPKTFEEQLWRIVQATTESMKLKWEDKDG